MKYEYETLVENEIDKMSIEQKFKTQKSVNLWFKRNLKLVLKIPVEPIKVFRSEK